MFLQMTQQLTDVLNKDLKPSCRWWGGFDLFRRLLFIIVILIFNYTHPQYSQVGTMAQNWCDMNSMIIMSNGVCFS